MGSANGKTGDGSGRKNLIRAAVRLFARQGYDGTPVRQLAAEAGVSTGLIRKYFGSKDGLREAADTYVLDRIRRYTHGIFTGPSASPMLGMPDQAARFVRREADVLAYLRYALTDPAGRGETIVGRYISLFEDEVLELKQRDLLADGVDEQWAPYILMFLQMGPLIIEPYVRKQRKVSLYDRPQISARNAAYRNLLAHALFRPVDESAVPEGPATRSSRSSGD